MTVFLFKERNRKLLDSGYILKEYLIEFLEKNVSYKKKTRKVKDDCNVIVIRNRRLESAD